MSAERFYNYLDTVKFALMTTIPAYPFDTVKSVMQNNQFSLRSAITHLYSHGNYSTPLLNLPANLYSGYFYTLPRQLAKTPYRLMVQDTICNLIAYMTGCYNQNGHPSHEARLLAAMPLAFIDTATFLPLEVAKIKSQTNNKYQSNSPLSAVEILIKLYQEKQLARGFSITAAKSTIAWYAYFGTGYAIHNIRSNNHEFSWPWIIGASFADAIIKVGLTQPLDVIKTTIQASSYEDKRTIPQVAKDIFAKHGCYGFATGFLPRAAVGFFAAFTGFYHLAKQDSTPGHAAKLSQEERQR